MERSQKTPSIYPSRLFLESKGLLCVTVIANDLIRVRSVIGGGDGVAPMDVAIDVARRSR